MKEIIDRIRGAVEEEIKKVGFIDDSDSVGVQRFLDSLIYGLIEDTELEFDVVMNEAREYLEESCNKTGEVDDKGDYVGCYYSTKMGDDIIKAMRLNK